MAAVVIWLKVVHISALVFWMAALLYLPALLAAHPGTHERRSFHRLRGKTRVLYLGIASPAAILAIVSGSALIEAAGAHGGWLVLKLAAVALMVTFHVYLGSLLTVLRERPVERRPWALASLAGVPAVLITAVLYLVIAKPI